MAILVTGGTGFVGRYVVDAFIECGATVVSYNRDYSRHAHPTVICVQGELFDLPRLVGTVTEHGIDTIIHTAAMSHPHISIDLPITTFAANVDGTLNLFEAARMGGVRRIVNFSSECAYGHQPLDTIVTETACPNPNTPYAVTKVTTEHLGRVYNDLYGLDIVSLRISEVYGPGLRMPEILKDMLSAALRGDPFSMPEGAEHPFRFVHVEDVARAAVLAAKATEPNQTVYNIAGGPAVTLTELAATILLQYPDAHIDIGPGYWTGWDLQGPWDTSAATRDLDYTPQWALHDGLEHYASWLTADHLATQ